MRDKLKQSGSESEGFEAYCRKALRSGNGLHITVLRAVCGLIIDIANANGGNAETRDREIMTPRCKLIRLMALYMTDRGSRASLPEPLRILANASESGDRVFLYALRLSGIARTFLNGGIELQEEPPAVPESARISTTPPAPAIHAAMA